jgi:hypothetical protein
LNGESLGSGCPSSPSILARLFCTITF